MNTMVMKYQVVLEHCEEGYAVWVPELPGCVSQGVSEEEALENIANAVREYLAAVADLNRNRIVREVEVEIDCHSGSRRFTPDPAAR